MKYASRYLTQLKGLRIHIRINHFNAVLDMYKNGKVNLCYKLQRLISCKLWIESNQGYCHVIFERQINVHKQHYYLWLVMF